MQYKSLLSFILLLTLSPRCLARGGGGGGGSSGGSSGDSGDSSGGSSNGGSSASSGGGNDDDDDDGSDSGSSSGGGYAPYTPPCTTCDCRQIDKRVRLYELPASYYNGTITVRHQVTANSARDNAANADSGSGCPARDSTERTYDYPALFTIGSNLNASDTNPIFWNLRGFPIPDRYGSTPNQIDVIFDWIHIRSADIATAFSESADVSSSYPRKTQTYWSTKVSGSGPSSWTANASYTVQPQQESPHLVSAPTSPVSVLRSSNYITLSDVCDYHQQIYWSDGTPGPQSPIPQDTTDDVTTPTLFLDIGAEAGIQGIGSNMLNFTMNGGVNRQVVSVGSDYSCQGTSNTAYYTTLQPMQYWEEDRSSPADQNMWNLSATVTLEFSGALVEENSTKILDNSTDVPIWDVQSKASKTASTFGGRSTSTVTSAAIVAAKPPSSELVSHLAFMLLLLGNAFLL